MTPADRRRLALAIVVTLVALPALWIMQRDDSAPGRNTVGAIGAPAAPAEDATNDTTVATEPAVPPYLEGPGATAPLDATAMTVATGTTPDSGLTGDASFRRFDPAKYPPGSCQVHGAPLWKQLTIRNVDNDRTVTCINVSNARDEEGSVAVLDTARFLQIADLVDAPLPVEISW